VPFLTFLALSGYACGSAHTHQRQPDEQYEPHPYSERFAAQGRGLFKAGARKALLGLKRRGRIARMRPVFLPAPLEPQVSVPMYSQYGASSRYESRVPG
jgi:hypothetical protein